MRKLHLIAGVASLLAMTLSAAAQTAAPSSPESPQLSWPANGKPVRLIETIPSAPAGKGDQPRLVKPFGVAIDGAGRVLVADTGQRAIVVYKDGAATQWKGNAQFPLFGPVAVAADSAGKTYAVDSHRARVVVFDGNGVPVGEFGKDQMQRPASIAIDAGSGRILVGDVRLKQILVFNLASLKLEKSIGDAGAAVFGAPAQLSVNSKGRILVGDAGKCRILILEPDGTLLKEFPTECGGERQDRMAALAVDSKDRIYVADSRGNGSLQVFDPEGKPVQLIRAQADQGKEITALTGLAVDQEAKLYVVDQREGAGRLRIFAQTRNTGRSQEAAADRRPR